MRQRFCQMVLSLFAVAMFTACTHTPNNAILKIDGSMPEAFQASWVSV